MARNITIKNLAEVAAARAARPAVMRPQKVGSRWHMPKMSAMAIARRRKQYLKQGKPWPWDIPHKIVEKRIPFKGHLRDLRAEEKRKEIERCMKRMPQLVADYRRRKTKKEKRQGLQLVLTVTEEEAEKNKPPGRR